MRRNQILTNKQEGALKELAVEKLTELAHLPERKDLLKEIEVALIEHQALPFADYVKDRILILTQNGIVERTYVPHPSWFKGFLGRQKIPRDQILSEVDFEKIAEDYELEPEDLQKLIDQLRTPA